MSERSPSGVRIVTWAKVDDNFHAHPKVLKAWKEPRALAAWVRCLSYAAEHELDGHVPSEYIESLIPDKGERGRVTQALIESGLWSENGSGIVFHDWAIYQPTKADLAARRAADAKRKRGERDA